MNSLPNTTNSPRTVNPVTGIFSSKVCKKCGSTKFYKSGKCKPCRDTKSAQYRQEHPEYFAKYLAQWRKNNPEYLAQYRIKNPESNRIHTQNRRAKRKAVGGVLSNGLAEKLFKLQCGKCACCGKPLGNNYHLDHRMPLALGGANEDWNIQLLRQQCNNQKKSKHPIEFMQSRGYLL
jgi:5-methylcytosine-specific restriction endonuclease McrA